MWKSLKLISYAGTSRTRMKRHISRQVVSLRARDNIPDEKIGYLIGLPLEECERENGQTKITGETTKKSLNLHIYEAPLISSCTIWTVPSGESIMI